jgi:hypothetical protein
MKLEIKKIEPQVVEHFDPEGNSLGFLNEYENIYLRWRVAKESVEGYYLMFEDKKITINTYGKLSDWPYGLYDVTQNLIAELFKIQHKKHKENLEIKDQKI